VYVKEIRIHTDRRTQLIDITQQVREALNGGAGSALLVYVPHTTAAVTINEKIDPDLVEDLEGAFETLVGDDWRWTHDDKDGPNGPSHGRASVVGPQVLVPLRDGELGLGTYQGIFFCEFDGPRSRSVYVSVLQ
jgi:secondary thiamine-phosphate synthase enzyme